MPSFSRRPAILIGTGALLLASACHKDTPAPDANTSLLAAHAWRIVASTSTDNMVTPAQTTNWYATFPVYRKDDTYQFNTDGSLLFDEGQLKEKTTDPQTATGKWQFDAAQQAIAITLGKTVPLGTTGITSTTGYTIRKLSADTLRLTTGTQAQTVVQTLAR
ncbi:DUF5004 domain-containing protein [Hymenobacter baengnokdamensis]|uniref:DUF5004 domain-containing protein n=1 Tax=Hymenobacter baengnokdamensis TaxID=2615203 RepID=UPI0012454883|nr:DUF5004 domain-containing protein [Hymenobacter baengnokdamensis]